MLDVVYASSFKKDLKRIVKRGKDISKLSRVIDLLRTGSPLPASYRDHLLTGNYRTYRECHIEPDWLFVYRIERDQLQLLLAFTGTHSDLF